MGAKLVRGKREREAEKKVQKEQRGWQVCYGPLLPPSLLQRLIMQSKGMLTAFLGCSFSRGSSAGKRTKFCQGKLCPRDNNNEKRHVQ